MKKNYNMLSIVMISILVLSACGTMTQTPPIDTIVTVEPDPNQLRQEIESQISALSTTLESLKTLSVSTEKSLATAPLPTVETPLPAVTATLELEPPAEAGNKDTYTGETIFIEGEGIQFELPLEIAANATIGSEGVTGEQYGEYFTLPSKRMVEFEDYVIQDHTIPARIHIYPVEEYRKIMPEWTNGQMDALQALLDDTYPDLRVQNQLPFLPYANAGPVFHALEERISNQTHSGIRYLTQYTQSYAGIANGQVFYTYQGFSADGRYYISAWLPIDSSILEGKNEILNLNQFDQMPEDYYKFRAKEVASFILQDGGVITPNLEALDALIRSLNFTDLLDDNG